MVASQNGKQLIFRIYTCIDTEFNPLMIQGLSVETKKINLLWFCDQNSCVVYNHGGESLRYFQWKSKGLEEAKLKFGSSKIQLDQSARVSKENNCVVLYYTGSLKNAHG